MLTPWVLLGLSNYCKNYVGVEHSLKCASVLQFIHQNASVLCADASVLDQSTFSAQNAPNVWHRRGRGRGESKGTAGELSGKEGWKGREKTKGEGSCTLTEVFKSRRLCIHTTELFYVSDIVSTYDGCFASFCILSTDLSLVVK